MNKILVADDDRFLASAIRLKLTKEGFEVRVASDGDEALAALKEFVPDLILLDLVMPNKDGFATLTEIKANPAWKNIPVIIASNLGQKEDIDKGWELGAADYVVKSDMALKDLVAKIRTLIGA